MFKLDNNTRDIGELDFFENVEIVWVFEFDNNSKKIATLPEGLRNLIL